MKIGFLSAFFVFLISLYRSIGSAWLGGACRFQPSCSEYAILAFKTHPTLTALKLVISRISRCRPFGQMGYDPVPCCANHASSKGNSIYE